jgi:hypothetical protein
MECPAPCQLQPVDAPLRLDAAGRAPHLSRLPAGWGVPSMASSPPRLARAPDYRRVLGDRNHHKVLAHRAYKAARQAAPIPPTLIDRLWTNALLAAELAPPAVAMRMYRRSETLLRLLVDQHNWKRP